MTTQQQASKQGILAALHFTLLRGVSCSRNRVTGGRAGAWHGMESNEHASGSVQMAAITFVLGWPISAGRMNASAKSSSCRSNLSSHPMSICCCREVSCHCYLRKLPWIHSQRKQFRLHITCIYHTIWGHGVGIPWGAEGPKLRAKTGTGTWSPPTLGLRSIDTSMSPRSRAA
jgi:hypothetical protein